MDTLLAAMLQSPKLPDYVRQLQLHLDEEQTKRKEFYKNVRDDEKAEFIAGKVICHSPAKEKHNAIIQRLNIILFLFTRKNKLGIIRTEKALVQLRRNDFEPDIRFFRKEIADGFQPDTMFYPVPDFVVEVLSQSTQNRDRGIKFVDYAYNGVKEYWIIDADKKIIEQYFLEEDKFILSEKIQHGTVCCKCLNDFEIPLSAIFDDRENEIFINKI